ncbi:Hint domain-containing protein, partial [Streptomyces sp. P17]|uniref:Hint domain-containing protein n=1 Tax=Streptomyces sp. P17 TaxID=3074716 RepID=UPI0028F42822
MFGSETVLIAAIRLVDLPGIYIDDSVDFVEYFHLIFKRHEVIFAEGAATESFLMNFESKNKLTKLQRKEMAVIFPEFFEEGY